MRAVVARRNVSGEWQDVGVIIFHDKQADYAGVDVEQMAFLGDTLDGVDLSDEDRVADFMVDRMSNFYTVIFRSVEARDKEDILTLGKRVIGKDLII